MYISINSTFKHILSNYLILFDKYKSMYKSRIEIVDFLYKKKKKGNVKYLTSNSQRSFCSFTCGPRLKKIRKKRRSKSDFVGVVSSILSVGFPAYSDRKNPRYFWKFSSSTFKGTVIQFNQQYKKKKNS